MDEIIDAVADSIPKFNQYLLETYVKTQVESAPTFIDMCLREAVKLNSGAVEYIGYEVVRPEERTIFEMGKSTRKICFWTSELLLMKYKFRHEGRVIPSYIYVPYLVDNMLVIKSKIFAIHKGISEQVFSRRQEKHGDGIMIRPIRARIPFTRKHSYLMKSANTDYRSTEFIITAGLHHRAGSKSSIDKTIILYLLCKFGFANVLHQFGMSTDDVGFCDHINQQDTECEYFPAKKVSRNSQNSLYLRVKRHVLDNKIWRKVIGNLLYTLVYFDIQTVDDLYDPSGSIYRVMLGKIISPNDRHASQILHARNAADTHIASVDIFLDPITRKRFNRFGVKVDDIYQLLYYVFVEIDRIMVNSPPQDLYTKRIDVTDSILIKAYAEMIFRNFYRANQRHNLRSKEVSSLVKFKPMAISAAYSSRRRGSGRVISTAPSIYNDSQLVSSLIFKIRHAGGAEQRFHPSMAYVESIVAFSGENIGQTGSINPFCIIDADGGIVRQDYCDDIDDLLPDLPK